MASQEERQGHSGAGQNLVFLCVNSFSFDRDQVQIAAHKGQCWWWKSARFVARRIMGNFAPPITISFFFSLQPCVCVREREKALNMRIHLR